MRAIQLWRIVAQRAATMLAVAVAAQAALGQAQPAAGTTESLPGAVPAAAGPMPVTGGTTQTRRERCRSRPRLRMPIGRWRRSSAWWPVPSRWTRFTRNYER